jgi:hypothetical protein
MTGSMQCSACGKRVEVPGARPGVEPVVMRSPDHAAFEQEGVVIIYDGEVVHQCAFRRTWPRVVGGLLVVVLIAAALYGIWMLVGKADKDLNTTPAVTVQPVSRGR